MIINLNVNFEDNKMAAGETIVEDVQDEELKAGDLPTTSKGNKANIKDPSTNIEIDESLFNTDDLDGIDDELDDLELDQE